MEIYDLREEEPALAASPGNIGHRVLLERPDFRSGLVLFRAARGEMDSPPVSPEITHPDWDVWAHVVKGSGGITVEGVPRALGPGMIIHVPAGTPHDFAAGEEDLVLFYSLIRTSPE